MGITEIAACALPIAWIVSLLVISVVFQERSTVLLNKRNTDEAVDTIFSDITDPAQSYRIQNIYHDDGSDDSSSDFDWQDTVELGDDFSSSSMFDD